MKLYDFSIYAQRRNAIQQEQAAKAAVMEIVTHIEEPGSVVQLKQRVDGWFLLHQEVIKKVVNLR